MLFMNLLSAAQVRWQTTRMPATDNQSALPVAAVIVDDDHFSAERLCASIKSLGMEVTVVHSAAEAIAYVGTNAIDLAIVDLTLGPDTTRPDGLSVVAQIRHRNARTCIAVHTPYRTDACGC
jgi:ActR/RegA family two-component response regulator